MMRATTYNTKEEQLRTVDDFERVQMVTLHQIKTFAVSSC